MAEIREKWFSGVVSCEGFDGIPSKSTDLPYSSDTTGVTLKGIPLALRRPSVK